MRLWRYILGVALSLFLTTTACALDFGKPQGFVNDFATILTNPERTSLESKIRAYEQETSNEIVVATVRSLEGLDRFTYSQELFNAWKPGKADKNNGIIFLIAPAEHEAFINVGKGLEGALPDSLAGTILRNEVFPLFKENNYAAGIDRGVTSIMAATKGEYTAERQNLKNIPALPFNFILPFAFFIITYIGTFLARTKSWWLGGLIGGGIGTIAGVIFFTSFGILIAAFSVGTVGLILDFILSRNYASRKARGLPTDFWHSGGGFWGGGRSGFGGGGFGGFGGGRSGGGGAGGSW